IRRMHRECADYTAGRSHLIIGAMRIGIDGRLPYYEIGGISQYVLQLLSALAALDSDNEYLVLKSRKDRRDRDPEGAPNFSTRSLWTPCHHRFERWTLGAEVLPHKLDVLHSPDFIPPSFGAKRHVITVHDLNFVHFPGFITEESRNFYARQIAWAVQKADHIAADSHHTRRDLIELLEVPPNKITTIHLAANPIFLRQPAKRSVDRTLEDLNLSRGYVLFVGTLSPRKNVEGLVRAYSRLAREASFDSPLILAGGRGWLDDSIFKTVMDLGLESRVRHLSGIGDERLVHLYHGAGVLVLPSLYEGFGLPPLEAMLCGCPVVVSDRASLPEVVGDAGLLIDPEDDDSMAGAILNVLTDSRLREDMIKKGYRQAQSFSWEKTAKETLQVYLQLDGNS
ncbi:MAG: glycosyltransferase family 4 protein, partial [Anaerolineaceae bacterium]